MSDVVLIMHKLTNKMLWGYFSLTSLALLRVEYSDVKEDPNPALPEDRLLVKRKVCVSNPVWWVLPRFRLEGETSESLFLPNPFGLCGELSRWWAERWETLGWHVTSPYVLMLAVDEVQMICWLNNVEVKYRWWWWWWWWCVLSTSTITKTYATAISQIMGQ